MISTLTKLFFRMTERLTDEQLRAVARSFTEQSIEAAVPSIEAILALRARVAQLEDALEPFARKVDAKSLSEALGHIEREHLLAARAALKDAPE